MTANNLRSCPHCGSSGLTVIADLVRRVYLISDTYSVYVRCNECGASGGAVTVDLPYQSTSYDAARQGYQKAAEKWNRRSA